MADLDQTQQKAFDSAQDLVKQLITLSTGVIALSITFFHDFAASAGPGARSVLAASWIFYIVAVVFGILTLMATTGSLDSGATSISGRNIRLPAMVQSGSFLVALLLTIVAGWLAL